MPSNNHIRTQPCPNCCTCGASGTYTYRNLRDKLFGAPGSWDMKRCNNKQCETLWLDPMPIDEDINKAYAKYYTHQELPPRKSTLRKLGGRLSAGYQSQRYNFNTENTSLLTRLLGGLLGLVLPLREYMDFPFSYFKDMPKGKLLEIGCGAGDTLKTLKDWGWDAEGFDFDEVAVANATAKQLKVQTGDLFSQNYPSNSFDAIFSSHVLEHVPNPNLLLKESLRILKPGGRFVSVMPNANSLQHGWFKEAWRGLEPPRHLHIFSPESLANIAKQAGLKMLQFSLAIAYLQVFG